MHCKRCITRLAHTGEAGGSTTICADCTMALALEDALLDSTLHRPIPVGPMLSTLSL